VILLLLGLAIALVLFVVTGGHLILLPLFFVLPLGFFHFGRRSRLYAAAGARRSSTRSRSRPVPISDTGTSSRSSMNST
jgi:hypothetical protein